VGRGSENVVDGRRGGHEDGLMDEAHLPLAVQLGSADHVMLRRHPPEHLEAIEVQCQSPEMQRWTTIPVPYTREDAAWFLANVARRGDAGNVAAFAVEYRGRFAGSINLRLQEAGWVEVAFGLTPWARGAGIATAAVQPRQACLDTADVYWGVP